MPDGGTTYDVPIGNVTPRVSVKESGSCGSSIRDGAIGGVDATPTNALVVLAGRTGAPGARMSPASRRPFWFASQATNPSTCHAQLGDAMKVNSATHIHTNRIRIVPSFGRKGAAIRRIAREAGVEADADRIRSAR